MKINGSTDPVSGGGTCMKLMLTVSNQLSVVDSGGGLEGGGEMIGSPLIFDIKVTDSPMAKK